MLIPKNVGLSTIHSLADSSVADWSADCCLSNEDRLSNGVDEPGEGSTTFAVLTSCNRFAVHAAANPGATAYVPRSYQPPSSKGGTGPRPCTAVVTCPSAVEMRSLLNPRLCTISTGFWPTTMSSIAANIQLAGYTRPGF